MSPMHNCRNLDRRVSRGLHVMESITHWSPSLTPKSAEKCLLTFCRRLPGTTGRRLPSTAINAAPVFMPFLLIDPLAPQ